MSTGVTGVDVEHTKALEAAATPGEWAAYPGGLISSADGPVASVGERDESDIPTQADAEFIAHARTAVPALVAAVERVQALHAPDDSFCTECHQIYPCDTRRALETP